MKLQTTYEWVIEDLDEYGDIQDTSSWDRLSEIPDLRLNDTGFDIGLMKRIGNEDIGEQYRAYAYIRNGKLGATFDDNSEVPDRFHRELARFINA